MSFVLASAGVAFTGDALLIRGCGRTDFQEGDAAMLYDSVWREILRYGGNMLGFVLCRRFVVISLKVVPNWPKKEQL